VLNNILYFEASDNSPQFMEQLWRSDGTAAGTYKIRDFDGGLVHTGAKDMVACGSKVFFTANDGVNGLELWATDGTNAGTYMVKDICTSGCQQGPFSLTDVNGSLYFNARTPNGFGLWKSNGTTAGTVLLYDFGSNPPHQFTNLNGVLFFEGYDSQHGTELWKSDGSAAGTFMIKDINPAAGNTFSQSQQILALNGIVCFGADDGVHGSQLWKSDGTAAGTVMIRDFSLGGVYLTGMVSLQVVSANGKMYFQQGAVLWQTDGTSSGTIMIPNSLPGPYVPFNLTRAGDNLFFTADAGFGRELYKLDLNYPVTGLPSVEQASQTVTAQPVPATGTVIIKNTDLKLSGKQATISDIGGRIVHDFHLAPSYELDIHSWAPGVYILHLPDGAALKIVKE
jgi:ELWxxDGT repeat protein